MKQDSKQDHSLNTIIISQTERGRKKEWVIEGKREVYRERDRDRSWVGWSRGDD